MINLILKLMENEALKTAFLKLANMSISASWLVLAILLLRLVLKKAPKWVNVLLWGIVAIRLICPFSFESALSLIPSAETIPMNIEMTATPAIDSGVTVVNSVVNPMIAASFTPNPASSANPLQIWIPLAAVIWSFGMVLMLLYSTISYWRLNRRIDTAVLYRDNIFQSENVSSPFVLGIIKPKIYLPFNMNEQDLEHVVAHEQAHIHRKDHWWKPLGFLLLTIHWFNPLMWLAFVLLCRDIELACDEKVIKELDNEQRANYTQALLACSVSRRMIAACPLAFGEVDVKERVKSVMNYKKPAFWIIVLAIATCIFVAICFLTNPAAEREFPINGSNVSTLDTERVVEMIAKAEKLDDGSQLCINDDNFDLMFTSDFEWANDGAIRFFYLKDQKTYSAQLRMFHDDNKYFITDSVEWVEQEQFFKLFHYLDALKYMPQEEIRKLSPDADGFSVYMRNDGVPGDYDRVLKYSQNGVEDIDGWYIHLEVQPLHKVEGGAYNGSGDELIHLFYGHPDLVMLENNTVTKWFDYLETPEEMPGDGRLEINLPEFPDVTFRWYPGKMEAVKGDEIIPLYSGMPIWNTYFCDLTGDGFPDLCSTYTLGSGIIDSRIIIYDYVNGANYELSDRGHYDFALCLNEENGYLYVEKTKYHTDELIELGRLVFKNGFIQIDSIPSDADTITEKWALIPMVMVNGDLYLDTGYESNAVERTDHFDGEITSQVDGSEKPTVDDQSNFGTGYGYQYGATEGTVELYMNGKWRIFATEEVRKEIQFPSEGTDPELMIDPVVPVSVVNLITGEERIITSNADIRTIQMITSSEWWAEGNPGCDNDFKITINGENYWYHSDCGTLNDIYNDRCISLDESKCKEINNIFGVTQDLELERFYLTIGAEGVKTIELTMPNSIDAYENEDGSLFKKGDRIWLECLDGYKDLRGVSIRALGENGEILWTASIPDGEDNEGFTHLRNDDWNITNIP